MDPVAFGLRDYIAADADGCLAAFSSNMPKYFGHNELPQFEEFLASPCCDYYVVVCSSRVIGCGGCGVKEGGRRVDMVWGLVHRDWHRQGIGTLLLAARMKLALSWPEMHGMRLATSQHTEGFYAKYGFVAESRIRDGFAPSIDKIEMVCDFNDTQISAIEELWQRQAQDLIDPHLLPSGLRNGSA